MRISQRILFAGIALAGLLSTTVPSLAGEHHDFWGAYRENKNWPNQYNPADRAAVWAPITVMIHKGWEEQNLLGAHHFKTGTNELTESGQLKVRWILTQAPQGFRTVYVERGNSPDQTVDRMASTRKFAEKISIGSEVPEVHESELVAHGTPAEYIDAINVKFQSTTPDPRLPTDSSDTGTGGGGSQ